jgi:hypothetical protein
MSLSNNSLSGRGFSEGQITHHGTAKANAPLLGIVIGTYGSVPYVHLHLEAWKHFAPDACLLVHDDCSSVRRELKALCDRYGAEFRSTRQRYGGYYGDGMAISNGLTWAKQSELAWLVKFSRRFVPILPWLPQFQRLIMSDYATMSGSCSDVGYGFVTNCVGFQVNAWFEVASTIGRCMRQRPPWHPETFFHNLAKRLHEGRRELVLQYETMHPKKKGHEAYAEWALAVDDFQRRPERLWYRPNDCHDYATVARCWGLSYSPSEFTQCL